MLVISSGRPWLAVPAALLLGVALAWPALAAGGESQGANRQPAPKPALLIVPPRAADDARLLAATEAELGRSKRYRLLFMAGLLPLMREADEGAQVRRRATALSEEGRQLLVGLEHERAKAKLDAALQLLEQSFVRFYDPAALAQVRLLRGMWALDRARPDLAHRELEEAHQLDPTLTLGPHYSPQVRAAFERASKSRAAGRVPSGAELRKLLKLAGAPVAVVLGVEPAGERALLRGAVYSSRRAAYAGVESMLLDVTDPARLSRGSGLLGVQLRKVAEPLYPAPATLPVVIEVRKPPSSRPQPLPRKPWYRRWYTWAAAGAVVAGVVGVVVPLATKREVVDSTFRW
jgi:hypothetical protein